VAWLRWLLTLSLFPGERVTVGWALGFCLVFSVTLLGWNAVLSRPSPSWPLVARALGGTVLLVIVAALLTEIRTRRK
jgi:hypothetical protein